ASNLPSGLRSYVTGRRLMFMVDASVQQEFVSALELGDIIRVRAVLSAGADVNRATADPDGETPLIRAVATGRLPLVQVLLQAGADVHARQKGRRSWTPLMAA